MKNPVILSLAALAALTLALSGGADARRLGGGGNFGAQRNVAPPPKAAPAPTAPAGNAATQPSSPPGQPAAPASAAAPKAAPATPAPAPSGMSRWLGPIAGVAAGLGLAALMSHLGLSEGFGTLLLLGLIAFAGIVVLRMFLGRRQSSSGPLQYSGAATNVGLAAASPSTSSGPSWRIPSSGDLSTSQTAATPAAEAMDFGVARKTLPQGFDAAAFAREAKRQYTEIQRSYDAADRAALAGVMTAEMATEIGRELDQRGQHQPTEIVTLDADVLDVSTEDDKYWISVRFTGLVKEDGEPVPHSIDEVWNLTKPVKGGSGWLLAGISQLA